MDPLQNPSRIPRADIHQNDASGVSRRGQNCSSLKNFIGEGEWPRSRSPPLRFKCRCLLSDRWRANGCARRGGISRARRYSASRIFEAAGFGGCGGGTLSLVCETGLSGGAAVRGGFGGGTSSFTGGTEEPAARAAAPFAAAPDNICGRRKPPCRNPRPLNHFSARTLSCTPSSHSLAASISNWPFCF